jgi:hypothetical protein
LTTLSSNPTYPIPNRQTQIILTLTESGANFVRLWVTAAPEGSNLDTELAKSRFSRIEVYAGNGGTNFPFAFKPDKGGKYTFVAQEYTKGTTAGPGYQDDPRGAPAETKRGSEATLTHFVGQRMTQQLGVGEDTAKLALYVWDATIRQTTIEQHGEATPGVSSPSGPRAKLAAESTTVLAALAALVGVTATTAIGTTSTVVSNIITRWNLHIASLVFHDAADAPDAIAVGLATATDPAKLKQFVDAMLLAMRQHFSNDPATGVVDAADYHNVGGKKNDWANAPLVRSVGNHSEAYAALADIHRAYEAHRASTTVHNSADGTALTALPTLLAVHSAFFAVLAATAPTAPVGQSDGAALLISAAGFEEEEP